MEKLGNNKLEKPHNAKHEIFETFKNLSKNNSHEFVQKFMAIGRKLEYDQVKCLASGSGEPALGRLIPKEAAYFRGLYVGILSLSQSSGGEEKTHLNKQVNQYRDALVKTGMDRNTANAQAEKMKEQFIKIKNKNNEVRSEDDKKAINALHLAAQLITYSCVEKIGKNPYSSGEEKQGAYFKSLQDIMQRSAELKIDLPPHFPSFDKSVLLSQAFGLGRDPILVRINIGRAADKILKSCEESKDTLTTYADLFYWVRDLNDDFSTNFKKELQNLPKVCLTEERKLFEHMKAISDEIQLKIETKGFKLRDPKSVDMSTEEVKGYIQQIKETAQEIKQKFTPTVEEVSRRMVMGQKQAGMAEKSIIKFQEYIQSTKYEEIFKKWHSKCSKRDMVEEQQEEILQQIMEEYNKKFDQCKRDFQQICQNITGFTKPDDNPESLLSSLNNLLDVFSLIMAKQLSSTFGKDNLYQEGEASDGNFGRVVSTVKQLHSDGKKSINALSQESSPHQALIDDLSSRLKKSTSHDDQNAIQYFIAKTVEELEQNSVHQNARKDFVRCIESLRLNRPKLEVGYPISWDSFQLWKRPEDWALFRPTDLCTSKIISGKYTIGDETSEHSDRQGRRSLIDTIRKDPLYKQALFSSVKFYQEVAECLTGEEISGISDVSALSRDQFKKLLAFCQLDYQIAKLAYMALLQEFGSRSNERHGRKFGSRSNERHGQEFGSRSNERSMRELIMQMESFVKNRERNLINMLVEGKNLQVPDCNQPDLPLDCQDFYQDDKFWKKSFPDWTENIAQSAVEQMGTFWQKLGRDGAKSNYDRRALFSLEVAWTTILYSQLSRSQALTTEEETRTFEIRMETISRKQELEAMLNGYDIHNRKNIDNRRIAIKIELKERFTEFRNKWPLLKKIPDGQYEEGVENFVKEALKPFDELFRAKFDYGETVSELELDQQKEQISARLSENFDKVFIEFRNNSIFDQELYSQVDTVQKELQTDLEKELQDFHASLYPRPMTPPIDLDMLGDY